MVKIQLPASLKGKNILISGAAGFVGSHLCEHYLNLGAKVIGLDNFLTGSTRNRDLLLKYDNFEFIECNIYQDFPDFKGVNLDYVFHLASPASPIDFATLQIEIMRVNSEGSRNLLELAQDKSARYLVASTSEVYGDPEVHPQVESYHGKVNCIGPRGCYDEAKRFSEALTMAYYRLGKVDTRIVRIFNTYGPRMRPNDGRVIPAFINQAMRGEDITVFGNGSQSRSFCYVTDLVAAMHNVMFGDDHTPINIGNPDEYTILETAEFIIKTFGSNSKIAFKPLPADDPVRRRPDISKLLAFSHYSPQVSFEEGLKKTAEYFKTLL